MTNDCKTCPVSTGTHKPAEAVHQIDEPATAQAAPSEVMGALRALHDSVELAIQRGALSERALEIIIMQPATDVLMRAAAPQAVQAATHPTPQGLADLRWQIVHDHISGEYIAGRACFVVQIPPLPGANIMRGSVAEHFTKAVDAIAAQAKQGGV